MPETTEIELPIDPATRDALGAGWGSLRQGLGKYYRKYEDEEPPEDLLTEVDQFYGALTDDSLSKVTLTLEFEE
jgi:hypothetical protein